MVRLSRNAFGTAPLRFAETVQPTLVGCPTSDGSIPLLVPLGWFD
ncbi:MAG: hypothetical protein NZM09_02290 [Ignavibacterium sp.]|nr:hypothetical protein [Ignavibacterium sp.]MDW8374506.1 hypothetical protein [Ignavibacteriales bacterium]